MPAAIVLSPRLIYREDLALTTTPLPATVQVIVLGSGGNPANVTPLDIVFYGSFVQAANDAAAGSLGATLGDIYFNTSTSKLRARMT